MMSEEGEDELKDIMMNPYEDGCEEGEEEYDEEGEEEVQ